MFSSKIKINLNVCFCFILAANCASKAFTFPAQNLSLCNCILLQNCEVFNTFIDNSSGNSQIKALLQQSICHYDGIHISVCCPDKHFNKRNVKEKPKLDYLDELTGLSCPPSFGKEYNYDDYLKAYKVKTEYNDDPTHYHKYFDNDEDDGNHYDHKTPLVCDDLGNCKPFAYSYGDGHITSPQQHPTFYPYHNGHSHHIDRYMHVPFFSHTHKNHYYTTLRITPIPKTKKSNNCGTLPATDISNIQVFPWITRLAYLNKTSRTIRYRCMGTIISDQYILTAAHCVNQLVRDLRLIYVRIGGDTNFQDYKILETILHPNYNVPLFNNDVALLRLAIIANWNGPLIQICLPQTNSSALMGDTGVVVGWSSSILSHNTSAIRYINLPIMNNTECAIRYAKYSENFENSIVITPTEFCAKAQAMNDVCEGDSGGPFMERSKEGFYTLLGIVAFGPKTNCGQSNLPGVYMRVSSYIDWIKSNIL